MNYPELGGVDSKRRFYKLGEIWTHPSGHVYQVVKDESGKLNWKVIRMPNGDPAP